MLPNHPFGVRVPVKHGGPCMNRQTFFSELRKRDSGVFGTSLSQAQVDGAEAILDAASHLPIEYVAYLLSTCYHETGAKMSPNRENLNYSVSGLLNTFSRARISTAQAQAYGRSPGRAANQVAIANAVYGGEWGRKNLGNTQPNDGWDFRGGGQSHTTGRTNYEKVKAATGVDVVGNSDLILDPMVSATALVQASVEGWYTGKKLSDYLPGDYRNARRVINGIDKADTIAGYARAFEKALRAAGYPPAPKTPQIEMPVAPAPSAEQPKGDDVTYPTPQVISALLTIFKSLFRRS